MNWIISLLGILLLLGIYILSKYVYFNPTNSEIRGYYFVYKSNTFNKSDLVLVCIRNKESIKILHQFGLPYVREEICQLPFLLKRVAAKNMDIVKISNSGIIVNDRLIPNTLAIVKYKNIYLNHLPLGAKYTLGKQDYFLLGQGNHSYDSRYFGVVHAVDLYYKAILLWPRKNPFW